MNPLGAITALNDLKNLKNRNKILRKKIRVICDKLGDFNNLDVPNIDDYQNIGGFHYGFPFFCNSEKLLEKLKSEFKIVKYNWPILDSNEAFHDPEKFINLVYDDQIKVTDVFDKSNDLRDELYFFDLKKIEKFNISLIKNKLILIKNNEN